MAEIRFDTGIVAFNINDAVTIEFNPTDSEVVEKIYNTFEELDKSRTRTRQKLSAAQTKRKFLRLRAVETKKCATCWMDSSGSRSARPCLAR